MFLSKEFILEVLKFLIRDLPWYHSIQWLVGGWHWWVAIPGKCYWWYFIFFSRGDWLLNYWPAPPTIETLTLPETNSSPLKMDGWNTIVSFWDDLFSGAMLNFRGVNNLNASEMHGSLAGWSIPSRWVHKDLPTVFPHFFTSPKNHLSKRNSTHKSIEICLKLCLYYIYTLYCMVELALILGQQNSIEHFLWPASCLKSVCNLAVFCCPPADFCLEPGLKFWAG